MSEKTILEVYSFSSNGLNHKTKRKRERERESLHMVFINLEKSYNRVPRKLILGHEGVR